MGSAAPNWVNQGARMGIQGQKGVRDFAYGLSDPLVGGAKALVRKPIQWASGGAFQGPSWAQAGTTATAAGRAMSPVRVGGRIVGGLGLGATGLGGAYNLAQGKVRDMVDDNVSRVYNEAMPQIKDDFADTMDEYLHSRGMLDDQGHFDPSSRMMKGLSGGADNIFRAMGMDPARLSGLQKIMILGGAVGGGGGLLAGSPAVAGMGGLSTAAGLLPLFMQGQGQQALQQGQQPGYNPGRPQGVVPGAPAPNQPGARNEWQHQAGNQ
jgi:hypothetical protein